MSGQGGSNKSDWLVYLIIFLVSMILLILGIRGTVVGWELFDKFIKELGFAGVIALILVGTIERFSRRRHEDAANSLVERINKDLFFAIFRRFIPQVILREFDENILRPGIFRTKHEVRYTFRTCKDIASVECEKYVKCTAESSYTLNNISQAPILHWVTMTLETPIEGHLADQVKILSVEIDGKSLEVEEIENSTQTDKVQQTFRYQIPISAQGTCDVSTKAELIKRKTDQEIWSSRLPSDGIKLTVSVPDGDLEVLANALHPEPLVVRYENEVLKEWELRRGMLPFQSIVFWWKTKVPLTCPLQQPTIDVRLVEKNSS